MSDAFVLAGAVIKGAFTAGALSVLSEPDTKARLGLDVTRIVGASSGALNGAYYAAAVRAGDEAVSGQELAELWLDDATFGGVFALSARDVLGGLGLSSQDKLIGILRDHVKPRPAVRPIALRLVVLDAGGEPIEIAGRTATTFEHVVDLGTADFAESAGLERVFLAAAASAALPGVFAPVALTIDGRAVQAFDGGLVDDTPLGHALRGAPEIDRVFVIAPFPRVRSEPAKLSGLALASHLLDVVIEERLVRDLLDVARVNEQLGRLLSLLPDAAQRAEVLAALGWTGRRQVNVVEIRPDTELPGDSFTGFGSRSLRETYVRAGVDAARRAVSALVP